MLMAMDSTHHGCSRASLLGDAVVVSMCLWGGLAGLYRVFGLLVAPLLNFKHCLCLTGVAATTSIVATDVPAYHHNSTKHHAVRHSSVVLCCS